MSEAFDINGVQLKAGDTVVRIEDGSGNLPAGTFGKVSRIDGKYVGLEGYTGGYIPGLFALVPQEQETEPEYDCPNGKHPLYDLIVAWAKGAEIQFRNTHGDWVDWVVPEAPSFTTSTQYRIKPKENKALQAAQQQLEDAQRAVQAAQEAVKKAQEGS